MHTYRRFVHTMFRYMHAETGNRKVILHRSHWIGEGGREGRGERERERERAQS